MKFLIVDDEPPARARLRLLVEEIGAGVVVGEAGEGAGAIRLVEETDPDVVLLDIRMPGMDGIEAARHLATLDRPPAVIFTTAYDDHALAAIEANAAAYLLKPIRRERLAQALEKAAVPTRAQLAALAPRGAADGATRSHVSATLHGNLHLVPVEEVRFFRAEHKYVTARHPGGELVLDDTLADLEADLGTAFLRVHRNALASLAHVRGLERDGSGRHLLRFEGVEEGLEVSRRMLSSVRRALAKR